MKRFWHRSLLLVSAFCLTASLVVAEELSSSAARMLEDVKVLASEEFEGRGVGTDGLRKAAGYVVERFEQAGLTPAVPVTAEGNGEASPGWFQEFEVTDGVELGSPNVLTLQGPDGRRIELEMDRDFTVSAFGGSGEFREAPVVFAGYGIEAEDAEYNDFENVNVRGKVVIVMRRNPHQADPHGPFAVPHGISRHAALTTKVSRAYSRGAVAVLFVNDPFTARSEREQLQEQVEKAHGRIIEIAGKMTADDADPNDHIPELRDALKHLGQVKELLTGHESDPLMEFGYGGTRSGRSPPCFHITQKITEEMLLSTLGLDLAGLEAEIDRTGEPQSGDLAGWSVSGQTSLKVVKEPVKNVIGVLEGEGPLRDETIVIGAHYDHLGYGDEGSLAPHSKEIHPGADDNASGTAGLIELARRLAAREDPLPRRIVFIAFTGEERGLLGSKHYVDNPAYPLEQTIAMFNMDMIGRMEEDKLTVFGTGTSSRWEKLVEQTVKPLGLELFKKPEGFGPSDHSSFYGQRIPVLHLFGGTHSDYHRPGDTWEKINARGMRKIIDVLERIVLATADESQRPDYVHVQGTAQLGRAGSRPYFGSIPHFATDAEGYAIQGVSPGSPAEKGGLKPGDVIVRLGENKIGGLDDFDLALRKFSAGEQVTVVVLREGEEVELNVTLASPK
jgi:hypothetical protein